MDALKALAGQQGCAADGTAAARNPLSQFVHQSMGGPAQQQQHGPRGPMQQGPGARGPMGEVDQGFAQGMGVMQGPRGPVMAGPGAAAHAMAAEFEQMQRGGGGAGGPGPIMMGPRGPMARGPAGPDAWANDFARMNLGGPSQHNINMEAAHRNMMRQGMPPRPMGQRWAGQMAARPPPSQMDAAWKQTAAPPPAAKQWANEMAGPKEAPDAQKWAEEATKSEEGVAGPDMESTRRATDDLVKVMASNPKFADSEFFDFISKVNSGELAFENNQVVETGVKNAETLKGAWDKSGENMDAAWDASKEGAPGMEAAWEQQASKMESIFAKAWEDGQNGKEVDYNEIYKAAAQEAGLDMSEFDKMGEAWGAAAADGGMGQAWSETQTANLADRPYELAEENKFANDDNAYERGLELFKAGQLADAILAFEAAVTQDGTHADAWRMLGVAHQENDQDPKAIACLERAVENDAYHLDALLGLGVSYVNELDQEKALKNLKAWVVNNPNFAGLEVEADMYGDGSLMDNVMQLMLKAQEWAPQDPEVQQVLGVLYNVSRDYNSAVLSFKAALNAKPNDYSLWNKLGATLANGQRSEEALPAYQRALELKPTYARGWLNMGISHSNLGNFKEAVKSYLRAIDLNPNAVHIWSYLRICFTCMERFDLIATADKRNLEAFRAEFDF